jgi:quinol-cytochrome oxidoreductase complex cytochrome b subunit
MAIRLKKLSFVGDLLYITSIIYKSPLNLTNNWNFGIYALTCLALQLTTGLVLAMHYTADITLAFPSTEHIMRDVNNGWLLRYVHAIGASMFSAVVYLHLFRGLYYESYIYPRETLWQIGVIISILMIITAFLGYVLPWGQMSFRAATVITNLFSAIPIIGKYVVNWLRGGYAIDNPTSTRFFALHYLLPFIILILTFIHIALLHEVGSNNPVGVEKAHDGKTTFHPYYIIKDFLGLFSFFSISSIFLYYIPNYLSHPDNYVQAQPLVTPAHIVPEWYFLPFHAISRSIPDKLSGVILSLSALVILLIIPFFNQALIRGATFRPFPKLVFWYFVTICILLGFIGMLPVEYPFYRMGQFFTFLYFIYFILIIPFVNFSETLIMTLSLDRYLNYMKDRNRCHCGKCQEYFKKEYSKDRFLFPNIY